MTRARVTVVGDVLLDVDLVGDVHRISPDGPAPVLDLRERRERPGGAGLTAVLLAARGADVTLVTRIGPGTDGPGSDGPGSDGAGSAVRGMLAGHGVRVVEAAAAERTRSVTRLRSAGQSLLRVDSDGGLLAAGDPVDLPAVEAALDGCDAVLVSDYGAGVAAHPGVRRALRHAASRRPLVWDPHPRGPAPVPGAAVVTPNRAEALHFAAGPGSDPGPDAGGATLEGLDLAAELLRRRWQVHAVAATDGASGVYTALASSPPLFVPAPRVRAADPCGAGDRFAGGVALSLAGGAVITEAVLAAVEDTAGWLARGGVASLARPRDGAGGVTGVHGVDDGVDGRRGGDRLSGPGGDGAFDGTDAMRVAAAVRAAGGTVVATGGCFDVVHAGHVACLQAARRLGDCLVVLLNGDDAVRRLKGPTRPVHRVEDRVAVLSSLGCVDAVMVFDDVTPEGALERLRPDVWAKGGDYAEATLPESALVQGWGGRVVLLPYLPGRSTTSILDRTAGPDPARRTSR